MAHSFNGIDEAHLPPNAYLRGPPTSAIYAWWEPGARWEQCIIRLSLIVYRLGAQQLKFVAPMPEQIATTTMHFSKV